MDRSQKDDLFCRISLLETVESNIDAASVSRRVETGHTSCAFYHDTVNIHDSLLFSKPFSDRNTGIEVICSYEDHDGIKIISMVILKPFHLSRNVFPLVAADSVDERCDVQPFFQKSPIDGAALECTRVSDGISQECYSLSCPWMLYSNTCAACRHKNGE